MTDELLPNVVASQQSKPPEQTIIADRADNRALFPPCRADGPDHMKTRKTDHQADNCEDEAQPPAQRNARPS